MKFFDTNSAVLRRSFSPKAIHPVPGSAEEIDAFKFLQRNFTSQFRDVFPDRLAPKTIVVVPSLSLDHDILTKVKGHIHYEERMLCMLMLLRMPQTHVVFVSSMPIDRVTIDYYLHLLPGITTYHAAQRLTILSCYDASAKGLTEKILERPRLIHRVKQKVFHPECSHLVCFNVTEKERTLAVQLGIPVFGCDPDLLHLGSKSGSRKLFRACNLNLPDGFEDLQSEADIVDALYKLKAGNPRLRKAVVKLNEGFSGEGNAVFTYPASDVALARMHIAEILPGMSIIADEMTYRQFLTKFETLGGVVEAFIDGDIKTSPSVQCRINPTGEVEVSSTHDQMLGGESGQVFIGALFPASPDYATEIAKQGQSVGTHMVSLGVLGRFAVDFLSVYENDKWTHYAIEINLRKGGTTHPYLMLDFLTDGVYDAQQGLYRMSNGQHRFYFASDNVVSPAYAGLTPTDLMEIAMFHGLMYDGATQEGVMFHLLGALSQYGKLGMVCIASSHERAKMFYDKTLEVLELECGGNCG